MSQLISLHTSTPKLGLSPVFKVCSARDEQNIEMNYGSKGPKKKC